MGKISYDNIEELINASEYVGLFEKPVKSGDIRTIKIKNGKTYRVTSDTEKARGGVQFLNRTSDFVEDLLDKIFKDYSVLYVYHASSNNFRVENPAVASGKLSAPEITETKNAGGAVEFQVECFVRVHDDFEDTPVLQYVRDSFLITYDDNGNPVYAHRGLSGHRQITEGTDLKSAEKNLKIQEREYREHIVKLNKILRQDDDNAQKKNIFGVLIPENVTNESEYPVYSYLKRRRAEAEANIRKEFKGEEAERRIKIGRARPVQLALFTLNVYVNQLDKKRYSWRLTDGATNVKIELEADGGEKFDWKDARIRDSGRGIEIAKPDADGKYGHGAVKLGDGKFIIARTGANGYALSVLYENGAPAGLKNYAVELCDKYSTGVRYAVKGCTAEAVTDAHGNRGIALADDCAPNDTSAERELWLKTLLTSGKVIKHGSVKIEDGKCRAVDSIARVCPVCGQKFYAEQGVFDGYKSAHKLLNAEFCCEFCLGTANTDASGEYTGRGVILGVHGNFADDMRSLSETSVCMIEGCNNVFHKSQGNTCNICGKTVCGVGGHVIKNGVCPECAGADSLSHKANSKLYKMLKSRCSAVKKSFRYKYTKTGKSGRLQAFDASSGTVCNFYPVMDKNGNICDYVFVSKENV